MESIINYMWGEVPLDQTKLFPNCPQMPIEIAQKIVGVSPKLLGTVSLLNRDWKKLADDPHLWKPFCKEYMDLTKETDYKSFLRSQINKKYPKQIASKDYYIVRPEKHMLVYYRLGRYWKKSYASPFSEIWGSAEENYQAFIRCLEIESDRFKDTYDADTLTCMRMQNCPMVRAWTDEGARIYFFRICRKDNPDHQVLFALREKKIRIFPFVGSGTEWVFEIREAPKYSRFRKGCQIPILLGTHELISLSVSISSTIYRSLHMEVSLEKLIKSLIQGETLQLNDDDPNECYCLANFDIKFFCCENFILS